MARRKSERARRRIAQRTQANALRLEAAVVAEQERPAKRARPRHQTQLEFLLVRGSISAGQRGADERLARDLQIAGGMPKVTASYAPSTGRPQRRAFIFNGEDGPRQIGARRRFEAALQAVGLQLSSLLMHVAVLDLPLADWSRPGMRNGDGAALPRLALYRRPPADHADAASPVDVDHIDATALRRRMIELNP